MLFMRVFESEYGGTTRAVTLGKEPGYRDGLGFTTSYAAAAGLTGAAFATLAPFPLRVDSSAVAASGLVAV